MTPGLRQRINLEEGDVDLKNQIEKIINQSENVTNYD